VDKKDDKMQLCVRMKERDSLQEMLGFLEVNGEAMEASPSLTS
jgi:hypothetical protein